MKSRKLTRVASAVVLVVTLASALTITTAGASGPTLVVTPSTNLHNGEKVKVSGSGFKPGDSVFVVECLAKASGEANCDISHLVSAKIAKSGKLATVSFTVSTGKIGNGSCGTKASNLKNCAVSVGNAAGGDSAVKIVTFKKPAK